jgi:hypothetical protein
MRNVASPIGTLWLLRTVRSTRKANKGECLACKNAYFAGKELWRVTFLPFDPDPRVLAMLEPLDVLAAVPPIGLALRRVVVRFLAEGDPRLLHIAKAVLYGGAFIVIAVSLWFLRHR